METYTITIDSLQSPQNTNFTIDISTLHLTNISEVEVLRASISTTDNSSAVYVYIDQLAGNQYSHRISPIGSISNKYLDGSIVSWNPYTSPRTTFTRGGHWKAYLAYDTPKDSLSALSVSLYNQNGTPLTEAGSDTTYIILRVTCTLPVSPEPVVKITPPIPIPMTKESTYVSNTPTYIPKYTIYFVLAILLAIGARIFFASS